jgi:hypothetical protein
MPRKFVTEREVEFVNSLTRELHQRVVQAEVYYYAIVLDRTDLDDLYNEAVRKTWASPVKVTARILYDNQSAKAGVFGLDSQYVTEVYFHTQELVERNLVPREGDFIEYGQVFYEPQLVFGQINNKLMTLCKLVSSREGQFQAGSLSEQNIDRSHPIENAESRPRSNPISMKASFARVSGSGSPSYPVSTLSDRVPGQRALPLFSEGTRPSADSVPAGFEIFNTTANQEQISDGTYWLDEDGNIVGADGVEPGEAPDPSPDWVNEASVLLNTHTGEQLPVFSNATRPPANLVPGLEIFNTDAFAEELSDGKNWRDRDGNLT